MCGMAHYIIRHSTSYGFDWIIILTARPLWKSNRPRRDSRNGRNRNNNGLFGGVTYYFAKTADDIRISSRFQTPRPGPLVDFAAPGAPARLTVSDTGGDHGGRLTLGWTLSPDDGAGANDVYGYKVYRSLVRPRCLQRALRRYRAGETGYLDTAAPVNLKFYYTAALLTAAIIPFRRRRRRLQPTTGVSLTPRRGSSVRPRTAWR